MKKRLLKAGMLAIALTFMFILVGCDLVPPAAPVISASVSGTSGNYRTTISWSAVSGAKEYIVYGSTSSSNPDNFTRLYTTSSTSVVHTTNSVWWYAVKASNDRGTSPWSNIVQR